MSHSVMGFGRNNINAMTFEILTFSAIKLKSKSIQLITFSEGTLFFLAFLRVMKYLKMTLSPTAIIVMTFRRMAFGMMKLVRMTFSILTINQL